MVSLAAVNFAWIGISGGWRVRRRMFGITKNRIHATLANGFPGNPKNATSLSEGSVAKRTGVLA